jgi:hypothetical protein
LIDKLRIAISELVDTQRKNVIGSRYQRTGEVTADREDLLPFLVNCRACELAVVLEFIAVTNLQKSINPNNNSKPRLKSLTLVTTGVMCLGESSTFRSNRSPLFSRLEREPKEKAT